MSLNCTQIEDEKMSRESESEEWLWTSQKSMNWSKCQELKWELAKSLIVWNEFTLAFAIHGDHRHHQASCRYSNHGFENQVPKLPNQVEFLPDWLLHSQVWPPKGWTGGSSGEEDDCADQNDDGALTGMWCLNILKWKKQTNKEKILNTFIVNSSQAQIKQLECQLADHGIR